MGICASRALPRRSGRRSSKASRSSSWGNGYSAETDGERKHLHLGIHKGTAVDISGYVANAAQLKPWINVMDYLEPKVNP